MFLTIAIVFFFVINVINSVLIVKTLTIVSKNKKINNVVDEPKDQIHNEYDLQRRLENFQKMKFSSIQSSRLVKNTK